jgi:hypothetical protein
MSLTLKSRPKEWSTTIIERPNIVDALAGTPICSFTFSRTLFFSFK